MKQLRCNKMLCFWVSSTVCDVHISKYIVNVKLIQLNINNLLLCAHHKQWKKLGNPHILLHLLLLSRSFIIIKYYKLQMPKDVLGFLVNFLNIKIILSRLLLLVPQ